MKNPTSEYLKNNKADNVSSLTDEQVEGFFVSNYMDIQTKISVHLALECVKKGIFKKEDVIKSMRKAMDKRVSFRCGYVENESANGYKHLPKVSGWIIEP